MGALHPPPTPRGRKDLAMLFSGMVLGLLLASTAGLLGTQE